MALRRAESAMAAFSIMLHDVRQMAVRVGLLDVHMILGGADAVAFDLLERDHRSGVERVDGIDDGLLGGAGVGECSNQHVAANSRKCVQVASVGHVIPLYWLWASGLPASAAQRWT